MRNRYKGICQVCKKEVPPKAGRWRMIPKMSQNFEGLRCMTCSRTNKPNRKLQAEKGLII